MHSARFPARFGSAWSATILVLVLGPGCKDEGPSSANPTATEARAAPAAAPAPTSPKDPCTLRSASAAHVARRLGIGPLTGPTSKETTLTRKCEYGGAETIVIEFDLDATESELEYAREQVEKYVSGATEDYPGFGLKAFSHTSSAHIGNEKVVLSTLGVLAGGTLVLMSAKAPLENVRALEADLLRDLGAL